jgi:hypothetical protein
VAAVVDRIRADGTCWLGSTRWAGRSMLRGVGRDASSATPLRLPSCMRSVRAAEPTTVGAGCTDHHPGGMTE